MALNDNELLNWKLEYDLLTNELFHLVQFTSLYEFDPLYRNNETLSFQNFITERHLDLQDDNNYNDQELDKSNEYRRLKKRKRGLEVKNSYTSIWKCLNDAVKLKYIELDNFLKDGKINNKRKGLVGMISQLDILPNYVCQLKDDQNTLSSKKIVQNYTQPNLDDDDNDDFYFTTSSEDDISTTRFTKRRRKKQNIKLILHPPKQTVTNPLHIVKPEFDSLNEFLQSYKSLDEDLSLNEYNKYINEQKAVVYQIKKGLGNGALRIDFGTSSIQPITLKDVTDTLKRDESITYFYKEQNKHTLQDHITNQGIFMSKLFQDFKKSKLSKTKKIAQMIEQHFKHIAGANDRKLKEDERRRKQLARMAMQAVKKRWAMGEKAFKVLKKDEEERLNRIKGKEHLSKMLEQSTQLLGQQLNQYDNINQTDDESMDTTTSLSRSEAQSESDSESEQECDAKLTIEQLREKYSKLNEITLDGHDLTDKNLHSNTLNNRTDRELDILVADDQNNIFDKNEINSNSDISSDELLTSSGSSSNQNYELESDDSINEPKSSGLGLLFNDMKKEIDSDDDDDVEYSSEHYTVSNQSSDLEESDTSKDVNEIQTSPNIDESLSIADVPIPSLLRGTLRTYQKQGLNWLASLYNNNTNGILADEMGLGKTIQTISLLAYLACEKENWGPHLIVVPTSVLLNWEMEFKRFAPGFKVLTYYGSPQQRKDKRKGWNKQDSFHVCITSYQLVVHDQHSFKRKKWEYMILDEAHNIKNFRSTRWQTLLNFNTKRRLLLTGTPLQNNLAELWSLLYFLMPQTVLENNSIQGFANLEAFQQWFGKPVDKIIETGDIFEQDLETRNTVAKLHQVLRPYLLRRLKIDVEKQMPAKYEHIVYCRLSKRQRFLYDDFMSRAQTKATLASGNFMSIINCLMQLRKVCNHPDLFEVRPILTSLCVGKSVCHDYNDTSNFFLRLLNKGKLESSANLYTLNYQFTSNDFLMTTDYSKTVKRLSCVDQFVQEIEKLKKLKHSQISTGMSFINFQNIQQFYEYDTNKRVQRFSDHLNYLFYLNTLRCDKVPMYGKNLIDLLSIGNKKFMDCGFFNDAVKSLNSKLIIYQDKIEKFAVITPNVVVLDNRKLVLGLNDKSEIHPSVRNDLLTKIHQLNNPFHKLQTKLSIAFPDKSLLQYDCGKLQKLVQLLQKLKDNGHRALIFTQMTKVLDILELFLNYHGYLYMRLDGATKIEDRQILTERFNSDSRITVFILSSRSGGLGINLTGADTVIFYDSDWNPAMDKQCQDRCHRIGQTRDVHIYRFVSEHTIESNILKKANQKRHLDSLVIQKGDFTTDYFTKLSVKDLLGSDSIDGLDNNQPMLSENGTIDCSKNLEKLLAHAEDDDDVKAAKSAMKEVYVDNEDFKELGENTNDQQNNIDTDEDQIEDEYEGTGHVEEYMIRFIANGFYYD